MIVFRTLGDISLTRNGTIIRVPKKGAALLALLCNARGRPIRRSEVGLLLWSGCSREAARHSLNQAVYVLRRVVGINLIRTHEFTLELTALVRADFVELEDALETADLIAVRKVARGAFFESFLLEDAPAFCTWH